jgi:hypothetical protein
MIKKYMVYIKFDKIRSVYTSTPFAHFLVSPQTSQNQFGKAARQEGGNGAKFPTVVGHEYEYPSHSHRTPSQIPGGKLPKRPLYQEKQEKVMQKSAVRARQ